MFIVNTYAQKLGNRYLFRYATLRLRRVIYTHNSYITLRYVNPHFIDPSSRPRALDMKHVAYFMQSIRSHSSIYNKALYYSEQLVTPVYIIMTTYFLKPKNHE
jgi:hypothetical protein